MRALTGSALTYDGDFLSLFTLRGVPAGTFDERMLGWINGALGSNYKELPSAMQAYAVSKGAYNWDSMTIVT